MDHIEIEVERQRWNTDDTLRWLIATSSSEDNKTDENHVRNDKLEEKGSAHSPSTINDLSPSYQGKHRRHSYNNDKRRRKEIQQRFVNLNLHRISKHNTRHHHHHHHYQHDYNTSESDSQNAREWSDKDSHNSLPPSTPSEQGEGGEVNMGIQAFEDDIQAYRDDMATTILMLCHLDHLKTVGSDKESPKFPAIQALLNDPVKPKYTPSPSPRMIAASIRKSQGPGHSRSISHS